MTSELLYKAIRSAGIATVTYSGRGMYGQQCLGIQTDSPLETCLDLLMALDDRDEQQSLSDLIARNHRLNSLGLQQVLYFPGVAPVSE